MQPEMVGITSEDLAVGIQSSGTAPAESSTGANAQGKAKVQQIAQFVRYSGWPELKEAFIAGQVKAAMLLAPMAMDLADRGSRHGS